ncbi:MAG: hypothetical protein KF703_04850 [Actinobacteria bacterium]|nr:hypothetical protein [Actinomycetota bacterium]
MLFPVALHPSIGDGSVTVAFRRWKRPTVVAGGTLLTAVGQLAIDAVDEVDEADLTDADARAAGHPSLDDLRATFRPGDDRTLYRIRFHVAGDDPRAALRADDDLDPDGRRSIDEQLARWDRASASGPWTVATLQAIGAAPGAPSRLLAPELDVDQPTLKRRVRQLKGLGLTESLEVGYRLSPRGRRYLDP